MFSCIIRVTQTAKSKMNIPGYVLQIDINKPEIVLLPWALNINRAQAIDNLSQR